MFLLEKYVIPFHSGYIRTVMSCNTVTKADEEAATTSAAYYRCSPSDRDDTCYDNLQQKETRGLSFYVFCHWSRYGIRGIQPLTR